MYIESGVFDVSEDRDHPRVVIYDARLHFEVILQSLSNSLLPFIESPYYYCHYKGLELRAAQSETPVFPPPKEDLHGFFHCLPDRLSLW